MLSAILLLTVCSLLGIKAAADEYPRIIQYTDKTFPVEIGKKNHLIMFYAHWCDKCENLASTLETLADVLNVEEDGRVRVAKVDCTTEAETCSKHEITEYPTLKFFKVGEKEGIKSKNTQNLTSLTAFIKEQFENIPENEIPTVPEPVNRLVELTDDTFDKHVTKGYHFVKFYAPWCGYCQRLAPVWDQLAQSLSHEKLVTISKIDCQQFSSVCQKFEVTGYPTLLWIEDGKKIDKYRDLRGLGELKAYVEKMLRMSDEKVTDKTETQKSNAQSVLTLTGDDFQHGIEKGVTFIEFFAPWCGHCKSLAPTWEELGTKFINNENVHIVKVDCTLVTSKKLCADQEVDGFPTLILYRDGHKIAEYNGSRKIDELYEFVNSHLNKAHDEL